MFMPFERQHQPTRQNRTPMADATGTPYTGRHSTDSNRATSMDPRDFREQADGAP